MKLYNVFSLYVIEIDGQKYICQKTSSDNIFREVFTKRKIILQDIKNLKGLNEYYSLFEVFDFTTRESLLLSREDILNKYIDINKPEEVIYEEETDLDYLISKAVPSPDNFYKRIGESLTPNERKQIKSLFPKSCNTCANGCCKVEQADKPIYECIGWQNDRIIGKYRVLKLNRKK